MKLFQTKRRRIPDTWISDTRSKIGSARTLKELQGYLSAIKKDCSPLNSGWEQTQLLMLEAYCSLKIKLIQENYRKQKRTALNPSLN